MEDKEITLPLGLSKEDVDIGTLTLIAGKIYKVQDITVSATRNVIGESTSDVKALCLSNYINVWAAFKPYDDLGNYTMQGEFLLGMLRRSASVDEWEYKKPNDSSGYALDQFGGYNHGAPSPGIKTTSIDVTFGASNLNVAIPCLLQFPEIDVREFFPAATETSSVGIVIEVWTGSGYTTLNNTFYKRLGYKVEKVGELYEETADLYTVEDILGYPSTFMAYPVLKGYGGSDLPVKIKVFLADLSSFDTEDGSYLIAEKTHFPTNGLNECEKVGTAKYLAAPIVSWQLEEVPPFTPYSITKFYNQYSEEINPNSIYPIIAGTKDVQIKIYEWEFDGTMWDRDDIASHPEYGTVTLYLRFFVRDYNLNQVYNGTQSVSLHSTHIIDKTNTNKIVLSGMSRNFADGDILIVYISLYPDFEP